MRRQSFPRLSSERTVTSTVLLVDADNEVRAIIERQLEGGHAALVHVKDSDEALAAFKDRPPALVVLNVDIPKGWPLCTQLKRNYATIPVIVVSYRLGKEVFNNHQKLDTRADAYHRLPDELEGLEISLGYFSSHRSETGHDDEDESGHSRPRQRRGGRVTVPTGVVQRLETTVAEQARALEDARRQIEALEVERDAVAEKNRRQMLELMAVGPAPTLEGASEVDTLKERISVLEAEVLLASRREDELREVQRQLAALRRTLDDKGAEVEQAHAEKVAAEQAARQGTREIEEARAAGERARQMLEAQLTALRAERAQLLQQQTDLQEVLRSATVGAGGAAASAQLEASRDAALRQVAELNDRLSQVSGQLANATTELEHLREARLQEERARRHAEERFVAIELQAVQLLGRAEAAESAWGGVNARLEQVQGALESKSAELDQALIEKKSLDQALATSRRLMREYATDSARKAEELKTVGERLRELEAQAQKFEATREELTQALEFEKSLVESLERDLAAARAVPVASPEELAALRAELAEVRARAAADLEAEKERARAEIEAERERAKARVEAAEAQAREDLDTVLGQATGELEEIRAKSKADLEAAQAQAKADLEAVEAKAKADLEAAEVRGRATREAFAGHVSEVRARFDSVVGYARGLEARLVTAEERRAEIESRLEAMAADVRGQRLAGEVPPAMELPPPPEGV